MRSFLNQFICLVSFIANAQEATSESNNIKLKEIREKQKEIQIQKTSDSLDVISKSQYGDPMIANSDAESMVQNQRATGTGIAMGRDKTIPGEAPASDLNDIHSSSLSKFIDSNPHFLEFIILGFALLVLGIFIGKKRG